MAGWRGHLSIVLSISGFHFAGHYVCVGVSDEEAFKGFGMTILLFPACAVPDDLVLELVPVLAFRCVVQAMLS